MKSLKVTNHFVPQNIILEMGILSFHVYKYFKSIILIKSPKYEIIIKVQSKTF